MKCPKCGGENCQFISTTHTHTTGFSSGDACCGYILMGPVGLLCGFCGSGSESKTKEYWVCNTCGYKFSQNKAREFMKEEQNKIKKFLFYSEVKKQSIYNENCTIVGERIKEGIEKYLLDLRKDKKVICANPVIENPELEKIKVLYQNILTEKDLIHAIIPIDCGLILAEKGIYISRQFYADVKGIRRYKNCVYIGQMCIRLGNEEEALVIYKFLDYVYNNGSRQKPEYYYIYGDLLRDLIQMPDVDCENEGHYSSQIEYECYITEIKNKGLQMLQKVSPKHYNAFVIAYEKYRKYKKCKIVIGILIFIIACIVFTEVSTVFAAILFFSAIIIWIVMDSKMKNNILCYIPEEFYEILGENEKSPLRRKGKINGYIYEDADELKKCFYKYCFRDQSGPNRLDNSAEIVPTQIAMKSTKKRFCVYCGKQISTSAKFCIFCGKKVNYKGRNGE